MFLREVKHRCNLLRGDTYVTSVVCVNQMANAFSKAKLLHSSEIELLSVLFISVIHNTELLRHT